MVGAGVGAVVAAGAWGRGAAWPGTAVGPEVRGRAKLSGPRPGTSPGVLHASLEAMVAAYEGGGDMVWSSSFCLSGLPGSELGGEGGR